MSSRTESDLAKSLILAGWERAEDVQPKQGGSSWPYLFRGTWRVLVGDLGWATVYRMDEHGIQEMDSARTNDMDGVLKKAK